MRVLVTAWTLTWAMASSVAVGAAPLGAESASPGEVEVAQLIERLGDASYAQRRLAARELQHLGLHAFEALWQARRSADPEVAAACEQLVLAATQRFERVTDPPDVRALLREYTQRQGLEARSAVLEALARADATEALCRLARFEPSERLSKEAAAELLAWNRLRLEEDRRDPIVRSLASLREDFGPSSREAVSWLWLATGAGPAESVSPGDAAEWWRQAAARERQRDEAGSTDTSSQIAQRLTEWRLRAALAAGDEQPALDAVAQYVEPNVGAEAARRLAVALEWIAEAQAAELIPPVLAQHGELISDRRGLYLQARIYDKLGDEAAAEQAAAAAFATGAPTARIARQLRSVARESWAIREAEAAGKHIDPLTIEVIDARWLLFNWRLDAAQYDLAARAIAPVTDQLGELPATSQWYADNNSMFSPESVAEMTSRRWLAEGLALAEQGDNRAAAEALEKAYNRRGEDGLADADVLIAMYRLDDQTPEYRETVLERIESCLDLLEEQILAQPDEAVWLNFWAWLVSNTVGDYDKAVRYSKRSLELRPEEPGLLDTLARCYFARGDVELAVETQRRAVELEPSAKVMQRQLAEFEAAWNKKGQR